MPIHLQEQEARPETSGGPAEPFEDAALGHLDTLYAVAFHMVAGDREGAEELVQETYARAYRGFPALRPGADVGAFLLRVQREAWRDTRAESA